MARIRTIKPEFPEDETLGSVSRDARLTYVLLWTRCDDHGRFRAATPLLRGQLYPYDEDVMNADLASWLNELADAGRIRIYDVDGQRYGEVINWGKHQRIDNAGKSSLPPPPELNGDPPPLSANRGEPPTLAAGREGKGREGSGLEGTSSSEGTGSRGESQRNGTPVPALVNEEEDAALIEAKRRLRDRRRDEPIVDPDDWVKAVAAKLRRTGWTEAPVPPPQREHPMGTPAKRPDCATCDGLSLVEADGSYVPCPVCSPSSVGSVR